MNLEEHLENLKKENKSLKEKLADLEKKMADGKFSEKESALKEREDNIKLAEDKVKLAEKKAEDDKKTEKKKGEFDTMLSEGKVKEAQRDSYMKDDMTEFIKNSPKAGEINLSEKGHAKSGDGKSGDDFTDSETPAQDEVISLAEKKMKEDKDLGIGDAQDIIISENSELREKYEKEVS